MIEKYGKDLALRTRYCCTNFVEELLEKQTTSIEMVSTYAFGPLQVQQLDAR